MNGFDVILEWFQKGFTTVHRQYSVLFQFTPPWLCLGVDTEWLGWEVLTSSLGPVECWSCPWGHSCYLTVLPSPWHIRLNSCCELDDALWCLSRNLSQSREYGYVLCSPASITWYISGPILWWSRGVARLRNELPIPKPDIPTLTASCKPRTLKHEAHGWWEVAFKTVICVCKELSSRTTTWQIQGWSGVTPKSSLKSFF